MRKYNYLQLFTFFILLVSGKDAEAQVRLKLALLSDSVTYQVVLRPEATFLGSSGTTSSAQVTIKVPKGGFAIDNITSTVGNWQSPTIFVGPQEVPNFDYFVFSNSGIFQHDYESGQEVILFSFENKGNCTGPAEIMLQDDPFIKNSIPANVGTALTIVGFGIDNSFAGAYEVGNADCSGGKNDCGILISNVFLVNERSCNGNDGTIQITASGGTGNLEYSINNGSTWSSSFVFNEVGPGDYYVKVREVNNAICEVTYSYNPVSIVAYSINIILVYDAPSCMTNSDGTISIGTDSQDASLQYSIDNGQTFSSSKDFTELPNDTYYIIVKETKGCEFSSLGNPIIFNTTTSCETPIADSDNDGIPDMKEDLNGDGDITNDDTDGDGLPNYIDADDDGDSTDTNVEENAPNGGDGNGDGIPDCLQNTVTSQITETGAYHTLVTGTNQPISFYSIETETDHPEDTDYNYPYHLDSYVINATGTVGVSIIYHEVADISNLKYRKFGPTTPSGQILEWYDYPHTLSTIAIGNATVALVQLTLTDNELGDSDATVGRIVDPGGLAVMQSACDISYQITENNGVYEISMLSNVTYTGNENTIASMQVSLRAPTGEMQVDDTCILDTYGSTSFNVSMVTSPSETPNYDYISFNINESFSSDITFTAGQTIPLFTFKNIADCSTGGALELIGTEGVAEPNLIGTNIGSQLSSAGGGVDQPICVNATAVPIVCKTTIPTLPSTCNVTYVLTETNGVYEVNMESNVTYTGLDNTIASMQLSFRAPTGAFSVDNTCIIDTYGSTEYIVSTVTSPSETPSYDYFNFTIDGSSTSDITFNANTTIALFSFKSGNDCSSGLLELIGTGGIPPPPLANSNVASQLSTLGGGVDQPICVDATATSIVCTSTTATPPSTCGVTFILSESNGIYQVSMDSDVTYTGTDNLIGSMQLSLRAPTGLFDVDDNCILDTYSNTEYVVSMVTSPSETPTYDYINFTINGSTTSDITFTAGERIPLFTFKNRGDCSTNDVLELVGSGGVPVPTLSNNNVASQLSTVGGGIDQPICVDATTVPIVCSPANCDVTYILEGPINGIYTMKMLSNRTYNTFERTISTMQLTLRTPTGTLDLDNSCILETYPGTVFELASEIINPANTPGFDYFSFSLTSFGTNNIPFEAGDTTMLFTFKSLQDCSINGDIYLVGERGAFPLPSIPTSNLLPQLFIAGGGGNESAVCVDDSATPIQCQQTCPDFVVDVTASNMSDCGAMDGQIVINTTPSDGAIFSIDNGATWHTNSFFSSLSIGTYTIIVAAADSTCQVIYGQVELLDKIPPVISTVRLTQPLTCDGTGAIEIITTSTNGVIYSINGGNTWSTTALFSDIGAGNYDITIANTDTTCVTSGAAETLSGPASPNILDELIVHPKGCDATDGLIQISTIPSSGVLFTIDGGTTWQTSAIFSNLGSGSYTIGITTADTSCTTMGSVVEFNSPSTPTIDNINSQDPAACGGSDGQITISSTPSTGLIYSIDGGTTWSITNTFTGLSANVYTINMAYPDTTCVVEGPMPIMLNSSTAASIDDVSTTNPSSCGSTDGQISINSNPATGILYSVDGGTSWSTNNVFTDLSAGLYSIRLATTDTLCPVVGQSITLENPAEPVLVSVSPTQPTDCSNSNGQIVVTSFPATGIIYSIDGGTTWFTNNTFLNVTAGGHDIRIAYMDTSCVVGGPITTLEEVPTPTFTSNLVGDCIEVTASCEGDFEYSLDGINWQASNIFCDLADGTYAPRIRYLNRSSAGTANPIVINDSTATPPIGCATIIAAIPNMTICDAGSTLVSMTIDTPIDAASIVITGGTATDQQVIGETTLQFEAHLDGLINFFTVTFQTQTGCEVVEEFVLYQAQDTEADFVVIEPFCKDGDVTIQFTGNATPNATLTWTLGNDGVLIDGSLQNGLNPANSIITAQWPTEGSKLVQLSVDDNGCMDDHVESIFVRKLPLVTVIEDTTICYGDCIKLDGDGTGVWYTWSPAIGLSATDIPNPTACPTTTTTYTLDIMGADGCLASTQVTVSVEKMETTSSPDTTICIGTSAFLNATGGTSYSWSPTTGLNSATVPNPTTTPVQTTTYTVIVTNELGCTKEEEVTVTVETLPTVFISGDAQICEGESSQLNASVHNEYLWSPAGSLSNATISNPIATPTTTTTYSLTVKSGVAGCTSTSQYTIDVLPTPTAVVGADPTICPDQNVQLSASGGIAYEWSPTTNLINATSPTPTVAPTSITTYTVAVTGTNGCTEEATVTVNVEGLDVTASTEDPSILPICGGDRVQLNITGDTGVSYEWSPATALTSTTIPNPEARPRTTTEYCVTVTDADGCTGTSCITVEVDPACVPCQVIMSDDVTICEEGKTNISALGSDFESFSWSPTVGLSNPNIANPEVSPSQTTTYTVTAETNAGCISIGSVTVTVAPEPTIITYKEKEICKGDSIHLLVNSHNSYAWSPTNTMLIESPEAPTVFPTTTTIYTVTVSNASGCSNTENIRVEVKDCDPTCQANAGASVTICEGDAITLNGSGTSNYSWSPAAGLSNPNIANPTASPTQTTQYILTGTSAEGCISTDVVTVFVNPKPVIITYTEKEVCLGESVQLLVDNHTSYNWSPSSSLDLTFPEAPLATPNTDTDYFLTVTNSNGCTNTETITVKVLFDCSPTIPCAVNAGSDITICQNQSMFLNASGAVNYTWSPSTGLTDPNIANPIAVPTVTTIYTVTGTNADGCVSTDQVTVFVGGPRPEAIACEDKSICEGENIQLVVNTHNGYAWAPNNSLSGANTGTPLAAPTVTTTYIVTVTNADGCTDTDDVTVFVNDCGTNPPPCTTEAVACEDKTICEGASIQLTVSNHDTYAWSPATSLTNSNTGTPIASPTVTTTYMVYVTDADGCTDTDQVTVFVRDCEGVPPTCGNTEAIACEDKTICEGETIQLVVNTHDAYTWSPAASLANANSGTPSATPTVTTTYTVTVTDADGCTDTDQITVFVQNCGGVPPACENTEAIASEDKTICEGETIQLIVNTHDAYAWGPVASLTNANSGTPFAAPTVTTTYTVTVTDADGCTDTDQVTVFVQNCGGVPPACENTEAVACEDKTICEGETIQLIVNTHNAYAWSPVASLTNSNSGTPLAAPTVTTTYTVTVTDADGCTDTDQVTVFVQNCGGVPPSCENTKAVACEDKVICEGKTIQLVVNTHNAYAWSPAVSLTNSNSGAPLAAPTVTTTYTVTVTDADGCTDTDQVTVFVQNCGGVPPSCENTEAVACEDKVICKGASIQLTVSNHDTYAWSPSIGLSNSNTGTPIASPTVTTTYVVYVTDADGCIDTDQVTVFVQDCEGVPPVCRNTEAIACEDKTICEGETIQLVVNTHDAYAWSPAASLANSNSGAPLAAPTVTTTYTVTVTDADGCTDTDQVTVFVQNCDETPNPCTNNFANAGNDIAICPNSSANLLATGGLSYAWSPATGLSNTTIANPIVSPSSVTVYTVTVTDANGCTDTDDIQVMVSLPIMTSITTSNAGCCGEGGGSITISTSGGFGNLNYTWSQSGLSGSTVSDIEMGTYTVTIADAQGCAKVETITVGSNCAACPKLFDTDKICAEAGSPTAEICIPVIPDEIGNYIVTVDGIQVKPYHGCNFENITSYSYALIPELAYSASFRVESWTINGVAHTIDIMTISDLTNWMNSIDREGFWILDNNELTLMGGIPTATYGPIKIVNLTDWSEAILQPSIVGRATGTLLEVDVSDGKEHLVVIENPSLCCREEILVSDCLQEQPCLDDMITADLLELTTNKCGGTASFCIDIPYADISGYTILQNGDNFEGDIADCSFENSSGSSFQITEGSYEFIFENGSNGCQDRLLVEVSCPENVVLDTLLSVGDAAIICLTDLVADSLISSVKQTCLIGGNEILAVEQLNDYCWSYTGLSTGMERFCIELCTTDGQCRNIIQVVNVVPSEVVCPEISTNTALSASVVDCFETATFCVDIPIDSIRAYGMLLDGRPYRDQLEPCAEGIQFHVPVGTHVLQLVHIATECTTEITFKVSCNLSTTDISETISKESADTTCLDMGTLPGAITSIENICSSTDTTVVTFEIDMLNHCIYYKGNEEGEEQACLVVCDVNGICDTILLTVIVIDDTPILPDANTDSLTTEMNIPITMRVMENDLINGNLRILEMTSYPAKGEAIMNDDFTITYVPENEFCEFDAPQSFEYRICNEDGCDTALIKVRIPCQDFEIKTGFSPNGDGVNDTFYIQGLQRFPNNELQIFNRWGSLVYSAKSYKNDWTGTFEDQILPSGTYFYRLTLGDGSKPMSSYIQIQR